MLLNDARNLLDCIIIIVIIECIFHLSQHAIPFVYMPPCSCCQFSFVSSTTSTVRPIGMTISSKLVWPFSPTELIPLHNVIRWHNYPLARWVPHWKYFGKTRQKKTSLHEPINWLNIKTDRMNERELYADVYINFDKA